MEDQTLLQEVRADVKKLVTQGAIHNTLLQEHKNFSIALQNEQKILRAQIDPVLQERKVTILVLKAIGTMAVGVAVQWLIQHLL